MEFFEKQRGVVPIGILLIIIVAGVIFYLFTSNIAPNADESLGSLSTSQAATISAANLAGCQVFPADNIWNMPIDNLPVHANSASYISSIGTNTTLHPDFGSGLYNGGPIGIPYVIVSGNQTKLAVSFTYWGESDVGPYPIPSNPPIEGGPNSSGDRHILILDRDNCKLYELFAAYPPGSGWTAGSGAIFDLNSHNLRTAGWTSADAAGLPILPGLVRYDEIIAGNIDHALRFTASQTQRAYIWPARHFASSSINTLLPPMGIRIRLKQNFDITNFSPTNQIILRALKKYGMFLSDNGSNWFISGVPDERWNNDELRQLKTIAGSNFEAVDEASLMVSPNSGQVKQLSASPTPGSILGDTDNDRDVDIFDFNNVVTDFAKTGPGLLGDVDRDMDVDIFDFNLVVTNFGRTS